MRMRKKKNLIPRMERCAAYQIKAPYERRGRWRELMRGARELRVEMGCGKGRFTVETAKAEPDVLFLAIEKVPDAMVVAMERAAREELHNVFFLDADVEHLPEFFTPGEVDRIYINFCDPWPKSNQAKRRLTHGNFLKRYRQVLVPGGQIWFKSDNARLFAFSVGEIPRFGFALGEVTDDLHANGPRGVMTDYEAKFYDQGVPIHRLVATMQPWEEPTPDKAVREFRLGDYRLRVDHAATKAWYEAQRPDWCECAGCRNMKKTFETLPASVAGVLAALGVDPMQPGETADYGGKRLADGTSTIFCSAWYHLCGELMQGSMMRPVTAPDGTVLEHRDGYGEQWEITDGWSLTFKKECDLPAEDFPRPCFQMELWCTLPWLLDEPNTYVGEET